MQTPARPWYTEPWPWILMCGPFLVVIAGLVTAWIAYTNVDPLVTDDYYRKGLQAGHSLAGSERAVALGVVAEIRFERDAVAVALKGKAGFTPPAGLRITLSHPTRAGLDQLLVARPAGPVFQAAWRSGQTGHWIVLIEDDLQSWRIVGKVLLPTEATVTLDARP